MEPIALPTKPKKDFKTQIAIALLITISYSLEYFFGAKIAILFIILFLLIYIPIWQIARKKRSARYIIPFLNPQENVIHISSVTVYWNAQGTFKINSLSPFPTLIMKAKTVEGIGLNGFLYLTNQRIIVLLEDNFGINVVTGGFQTLSNLDYVKKGEGRILFIKFKNLNTPSEEEKLFFAGYSPEKNINNLITELSKINPQLVKV